MSAFVHDQGIKTVHEGGRGSKNGKILYTQLLNGPLTTSDNGNNFGDLTGLFRLVNARKWFWNYLRDLKINDVSEQCPSREIRPSLNSCLLLFMSSFSELGISSFSGFSGFPLGKRLSITGSSDPGIRSWLSSQVDFDCWQTLKMIPLFLASSENNMYTFQNSILTSNELF